MRRAFIAPALLATSVSLLLSPMPAAATQDFILVIENHAFQPAELKVPAGQRLRIVIDNRDATAEEFESSTMRVEKIIPAKSRGFVMVSPLKPGSYKFFGDYNQATAQGVVIAE